MAFYENLADRYDLMTRFDQRIKKDGDLLRTWVKRFRLKSAIDVACGTGLHSILLAKAGVKTLGTDISGQMLNRAKHNAARNKIHVEFRQIAMERLGDSINQRFDALFCLGNSLPHILDMANLEMTIKSFAGCLVPGGVAIIQLLNYERILTKKHRLVGIHRVGDTEFIRYYDFFPKHVRFTILTVDSRNGSQTREIETTNLYPYTKSELEPRLLKSGFTSVKCYGDMSSIPYDSEFSTNLVICAKR
jgi:glycine/sarcosine N-methyltransferase